MMPGMNGDKPQGQQPAPAPKPASDEDKNKRPAFERPVQDGPAKPVRRDG
jgi:hypothetical protein